jgi:NifU-like protein involved in Fe-S cluster formation
MEFYMKFHDGKIEDVTFLTDGCGATIACGSMLTSMIKGYNVEEAGKISPDDLITALGGLPKDNLHCAALAVGTLRKAIRNFFEMHDVRRVK